MKAAASLLLAGLVWAGAVQGQQPVTRGCSAGI